MRRGVAGPARPQVQVRDPGQQVRLVPQVARVPRPGQGRLPGARGFGQVPGIGQDDGQHIAARPGEPAGDPGRDLPGLPGQPDRLVVIAGVIGGEAELGQGQQLPGRVPDLPGQDQRAAASPAASAVRPMSRKTDDRPARAEASARDGGRPAAASRAAVKWPSAPARSAEDRAAQPSQICAAHHLWLAVPAHSAARRTSEYWPASRPRSCHHGARATASRSATAASCTMAQASACRVVASSASSQRAAADSPMSACSPAAACSAIPSAYRARAASACSCSPASASCPAP